MEHILYSSTGTQLHWNCGGGCACNMTGWYYNLLRHTSTSCPTHSYTITNKSIDVPVIHTLSKINVLMPHRQTLFKHSHTLRNNQRSMCYCPTWKLNASISSCNTSMKEVLMSKWVSTEAARVLVSMSQLEKLEHLKWGNWPMSYIYWMVIIFI